MAGTEVVVGIDGSATSAHALDWAAAEAARRSVPLLVVHASEAVDSAAYSTATLRAIREDAIAHGQELLGTATLSVAARHPDLPVKVLLRHERAAEVLLQLAGRAAVLVLGTQGGNRLTGALLGSVSQRVAAHAGCPVVVVGSDARLLGEDAGVLVGVSETPGGHAALRFGCEEAARLATPLTAVRAYGVFSRAAHGQVYGPLLGLREQQQAVLDRSVAWARAEYPEIDVQPRLIDEVPTYALARIARHAQLLVLGCRHPDNHWPSRLGPVTAALLHHSPCPVAVIGVPPGSARPAEPTPTTTGASR